ncbi:MAG: hypothetical protein EBU84_02975 [Actinobacteria bacterium]|nr:hypothetical protein [Actinomycetota bacterium]
MKSSIETPLQSLIATNVGLVGLIGLAFLPEDDRSKNAGTIGWALYFVIVFIMLTLAIRSWVDYADYKRKQFRVRSWLAEMESVRDVVYLGDKDEPYDWAKEVQDPWGDDDPNNDPNNGRAA